MKRITTKSQLILICFLLTCACTTPSSKNYNGSDRVLSSLKDNEERHILCLSGDTNEINISFYLDTNEKTEDLYTEDGVSGLLSSQGVGHSFTNWDGRFIIENIKVTINQENGKPIKMNTRKFTAKYWSSKDNKFDILFSIQEKLNSDGKLVSEPCGLYGVSLDKVKVK